MPDEITPETVQQLLDDATPGPWRACRGSSTDPVIAVDVDSFDPACSIRIAVDDSLEEYDWPAADIASWVHVAALIAAAPDIAKAYLLLAERDAFNVQAKAELNDELQTSRDTLERVRDMAREAKREHDIDLEAYRNTVFRLVAEKSALAAKVQRVETLGIDISDEEEFCPQCLAGLESSEHHEKCVAPINTEAMLHDYAAKVHQVERLSDDSKAGRVFGYDRGMLDMAKACNCPRCREALRGDDA